MTTSELWADYLHRLNVRCHTELGWPYPDADFIDPAAVDRIVEEEFDLHILRAIESRRSA